MGALEFEQSGHSVGEMRRLIAQAQAGGETARANQLELELNWRMRRMAARHAEAAENDGMDTDAAPAMPWAQPTAATRSGPARAWQLAAAALAGAAVASVAGWWITSAGLAPQTAPRPGPVPQAVQTTPASAAPAPSMPAAIPASPPASLPVPETATPAPSAPSHARAAPTHAAPAPYRPAACRAPASPGQRTVCASRRLLAQDQRMLRAYEHARAAGANRATLDRGQAQWRQVRDRTSSPARLTQLYRSRIAALDAAARRAHAPAPAHAAARRHGANRHARHSKWWPWR